MSTSAILISHLLLYVQTSTETVLCSVWVYAIALVTFKLLYGNSRWKEAKSVYYFRTTKEIAYQVLRQ